ncbi:MAG TPA: bifunctional DNA-formamidopyrimidine glycosylase/DNA-(apurinic or apyrimidinic site) lyase [Tepidisphaeraceae bacterium]|jgi:formamidopyrimidine-DNA glycosylase|nr:bifunctional DNA-formamidopyrimidine glycosylase/DNA-(apurinic or apyrimidinic site) lyase [Tepidisphaeraceae bacterium]
MPELPEVETVVRTLAPHLVGQRISSIRHLRSDIVEPREVDLPRLLRGRRVRAIDRRGKKILIRLDSAATLCIHLGMTGRLTIEPASNPIQPHTHFIADLSSITNRKSQIANPPQLRFRDPRRFGGIWWLCDGEADDTNLGPEPLEVRPAQLAKRLARTRRAIKTALLDQRILAGIGNIYADESLFHSRIHPTTPANLLTRAQILRLNRAIKLILRRAINHRGSSLRDYVDADGEGGGFQLLHRVYARESEPCPRCKTPISRIVLGGRSTHFCPKCQAS